MGTLDSRPAGWQPVLGEATYPAPWQAWRIAVEPMALCLWQIEKAAADPD